MELQELYEGLLNEMEEGTLPLRPDFGDGVLIDLLFALPIECVEDCSILMQLGQIIVDGTCKLLTWNQDRSFTIRLLCSEQEGKILYQAVLRSDFQGTLGTFFENVAPTKAYTEDGMEDTLSVIADFPVTAPVISYDSRDVMEPCPLQFSAATKKPEGDAWSLYDFLLLGLEEITGSLNFESAFELEAPLTAMVTGIFSCAAMSLLLINGVDNRVDFQNPVISQVGLKLRLTLPQLGEVDFTIPLFCQRNAWSLHTYFQDGLGVVDIVNFMTELFQVGGSLGALSLPTETLVNQFRLYRIDLQTRQENTALSMQYLCMEFALAKPWKLVIPYVTLERLGVGFEVSFGQNMGSLVTASAGGTLSLMLGNYQLTMDLQMDLPELSFLAQTTLQENSDDNPPGMAELAETFQVTLPRQWQQQNHLLGQITVTGSGRERSFSVTAEVNQVLSFSVGDLEMSLTSVETGATVCSSGFDFFVQGRMEFGTGEDAFSLFMNASYQNSGWKFSGGLHSGTIDLGQLLSEMFRMENPAEDIISLSIMELDISYETETERFLLTTAFAVGWKLLLLGKEFTLGGRLQLCKEGEKALDIAALAYIYLGDFKLLAQIDHAQQKENRSYLFRLEYDQAYLQAAWFQRNQDEILAVSLGGMTLGSLVEALVRMVNPNKKYTLSAPWNVLNKIQLSKLLFELNVTKNLASFLYQAKLNIAGLMYLDTIGITYNMNARTLDFVLTGKLLGITYGEDNPITWDVLDGQPPANSADNEKKFQLAYFGIGQHLKNDGLQNANSVSEAVSALKEQLNPQTISQGISYDAGTNWLFGVDFTVNGMINAKLVLNDPVLYGLLITVHAGESSALKGLDGFGMELLCKRVSQAVYMFRGELLVPRQYRTFDLGAVKLTLGTIRAQVYTNGGFYVDLGFPHQMDFSRSFVLEWGTFTGRGGIYFGVTKNVSMPNLPEVTNGNFSPVVNLGIGLSVGLGRSFDFGVVKGGVSLELFGVFEGVLAVFHEKDTEQESTYYYVQAAAGITGQLYLTVDFKIITVQAAAKVKASAMLTLQAYKATVVDVELALTLQASIKILGIKIKFSYSFEKKVSFVMGKDRETPWQVAAANNSLRLNASFALSQLSVVKLQEEQIHLSLIPMLYLSNPSRDADVTKQYGVAFLMMMEETALQQWTGLLVDWVFAHLPQGDITAQQMDGISPNLADSLTYALLDDFFKENVRISYDIHWVDGEKEVCTDTDEEPERFVFPLLPSLEISFGEPGQEESRSYWTQRPVGEAYFSVLTQYFQGLNPDSSIAETANPDGDEQMVQDVTLPIAKVFFEDYFRMFLSETIHVMQGEFQEQSTDVGVCTAAKRYGISVEEVLRQNPELVFSPGTSLNWSGMSYVVMEGDTIHSICESFSCGEWELWQSICHESFLVKTGSKIVYQDGTFKNDVSKLTLEQAAAFLFIRFYEELVASDMFYAGDIVRLNQEKVPELDLDWIETVPGGHTLVLPDYDGEYYTMRGDTPERISTYLSFLQMDKSTFGEWQDFYDMIQKNNPEVGSEKPTVIQFVVPEILVQADLDLQDLADRIYPDCSQEELPGRHLLAAPVLKVNAPIGLPDVTYQIPEQGSMTVANLLHTQQCTLEELGRAIAKDDVFCEKQQLHLTGVQCMEREELKNLVVQEGKTIGAMLSRFLLQGLRLPLPEGTRKNAGEQELAPLFDVLRQTFLLGEGTEDRSLHIVSGDSACVWVETEEKQSVMSWQDIEERLPKGDFSILPAAFTRQEDFVSGGQYFTLTDGAVLYFGQQPFYLYSFSTALQELLELGREEPVVTGKNHTEYGVTWGCLIPLTIGLCQEEGIFTVYGADSEKRLVLHELLSKTGTEMHLLYQTSAVDKGAQNFWEREWSVNTGFLARTNLSLETHMGFLKSSAEKELQHVVGLDETAKFLRMLWECSTVGGGGYYLRLETGDGLTLPGDIFDEQGMTTLWLLINSNDYEALHGCINCCMLSTAPVEDDIVTLVTKAPEQEKTQPVFPAGCVGLYTQMPAPVEENHISRQEEYMRSLFQITGYRIMGNTDYEQSNISAPLLPEETEGMWQYQAVVPMYRYGKGQTEKDENPYASVGKTGSVLLEMRDVLGNTVEIGETSITPYYNDVLIGIGQYPAAKVSYAIVGENDAPMLRLTFHSVVPEKPEAETVAYQRRAAMQLACDDVQVTFSFPINEMVFDFATITKDGRTYLDYLREYVNHLADVMENPEHNVPASWFCDFPMDMEKNPLPPTIFALKAVLTVSRAAHLAPDAAAQRTETEVFPAAFADTQQSEDGEQNLLTFCRDAQRAIPNVYFAQGTGEDNVLYGISYGENGFLKKLEVQLMTCRESGTDVQDILTPEFYAFPPLYRGFLSREASVRRLSETLELLPSYSDVSFSDVDMELWANRFLTDFETLLQAEQVKKAGGSCRTELNELVEIKEQLAGAISRQLIPMRQEGRPVSADLREKIKDRLKGSLTEGYDTDAVAVCQLCLSTEEDAHCRLTVVSENKMSGTQMVMGKADSGKTELYMLFTNTFIGKSIPFQMNIAFTELEYDIQKGEDGYESSRWLRFVEPVRLTEKTEGEAYNLDSQIHLPNPVRLCPQAPVLGGHECELDIEKNGVEEMLYREQTSSIGWDYSLNVKACCREQDTFFIRVVFESIAMLKSGASQRDLFDALAEYMVNREALWNALSEENGFEAHYVNAYQSFVAIAASVADLWESWVSGKLQQTEAGLAYSCMVEQETETTSTEKHFCVTSTSEGMEFLKQFNGKEPEVEVLHEASDTQELELRFIMKNLPLFSCAQAKPYVRIIRNQNLLTGKNVALTTREEFVYRTQNVSLPLLPVSGEYTEEYQVSDVSCAELTQAVMERAVADVYHALMLDNPNLMVGLSVFYYYGLDMGKQQPRVLLPVTLIPCVETVDAAGNADSFINAVGENIFDWYQEWQPVTNGCGLLFDIIIYKKIDKKRLLHFSALGVRLHVEE